MFVIRSKKTGKTFLRLIIHSSGYVAKEWVMFAEERPDTFPEKSKAHVLALELSIPHEYYEVVPLSEVPWQNPISDLCEPEPTDKDEAKFRAQNFPEY